MNDPGDTFCQERVAFNGRIVADATHEIQNHFAVIKEYSGLMNDLIRAPVQDVSDGFSRCLDITGKINDRASRAAKMVDVLNRFAHRGDRPTGRFSINEVVEDLALLLQRAAAQRRILLNVSHGRKNIEAENDASIFQYLLFSLTQPLIDMMEENGAIIYTISRGRQKAPMIEIDASGIFLSKVSIADLMRPELLKVCLDRLGGSIAEDQTPGKRFRLMLTISSTA